MANLALRDSRNDPKSLQWIDRSRTDARLAMMVARACSGARGDAVARVFVSGRRFPFDDVGKPVLPGLNPGFVTDVSTGEVFAPGTPRPTRVASAYLYTTPVSLAEAAPDDALPHAIPLGELLAAETLEVEWVREAQRLRTQLKWSVAEIGASRAAASDATRGPASPAGGAGVIIGVVDYGMDFAHRNFRRGPAGQGGTRLLALWDQNVVYRSGGDRSGRGPGQSGVPRGRVLTRARIDAALQAVEDPYAALGYHPHDHYYAGREAAKREGAHGTHVTDIAAGNGAATGQPGVAPGADLIFVQLPAFDWWRPGDLAQGAWVYEAAAFVFHRAALETKPAVVNLSLTTNTGTHDGTDPVELALAALLRAPGRAVVVCAGNERMRGIHATGVAVPGRLQMVVWRQPAQDTNPNQLLLCHAGDWPLSLTLTAPSMLAPAEDAPPPASIRLPTEADGEYEIAWDGQYIGTLVVRNGRQPGAYPADAVLHQVAITMRPNGDGLQDDWRLALAAQGEPVEFHAWIERDDLDQSSFVGEVAPGCTLGSLASCEAAIVVGAYNALAPLRRPAETFSSEGPTRDGRQKPDLIAPGVNIVAARSTHGLRRLPAAAAVCVFTGTSQAAPHVTGAVALLFAAAGEHALSLHGTTLRDLLRATARRDSLTPSAADPGASPGYPHWDPHAGCGRLSVASALAALPGWLGRSIMER